MVLFEEELGRLSLIGDWHHTAVALEIETTFLTEDGLVRSSMVPVIGRLRETMTTGVEAVRVCVNV